MIIGKWWNDSSINLIKKNKKVFALNGWNGEEFGDCWQVVGKYQTGHKGKFIIVPIYKDEEIIDYIVK